ncbi:unnamed protein product [Gongylonema pulchrum]|uniref:DUF2235 domain-containing protein n=1 Tax=Gongylonema pulchrum TaxID=637853 RepID=A0A183DNL3_9BILA|nr:unnamed protein product [Gongylonema pulchrum]
MAKHIFYELGSSLIYHLKFRASWYFIGQKGIDGYTPFEDMNIPSSNDWAKPINVARLFFSVDGVKTVGSHPPKTQNMLRRHFCARYDGYEEFCDGPLFFSGRILCWSYAVCPRQGKKIHVTQDVVVAFLLKLLLDFCSFLVAGLSTNNIRLCLESIYEQDGINPQNVVVAFDPIDNEVSDLSALFHVRALPVNGSLNYDGTVTSMLSLFLFSTFGIKPL